VVIILGINATKIFKSLNLKIIKMSKEFIKKIFERLPIAERKMPAIIIDGQTLTWEEAWIEVRDDKSLAEKIQKKIEELKKNV